MDFQKGAVWCACLYLFISLLLNRKINYKEVFLFSHYTLRMRKLIDRKNTDCFPLWRERGTIRQDGWWKVESSMLERRKACWCAPFEVDCLAYLSQALMRARSSLIENSYEFPIVRNCGQWREDILVIPCATSITQKLPLEVFAVPPFDAQVPSRIP